MWFFASSDGACNNRGKPTVMTHALLLVDITKKIAQPSETEVFWESIVAVRVPQFVTQNEYITISPCNNRGTS